MSEDAGKTPGATQTDLTDRKPDSRTLACLLDELLQGWKEFVGDNGPELSQWRHRTRLQVTTILALTAHVHQTAMILQPALPDGLTIAHMPLVRSLFESTITASWCDEVADGANGLLNEGVRQRRNLSEALAKTRSMSQIAEQIADVGLGVLPTSSSDQARRIEARCNDVAFDGAYALYRMLSSQSHVSTDTLDAYLDDQSLAPDGSLSIKSNPGVLGSSYAWSHMVACCLVWSGMVANYLDPGRTRRNDLRRIARALDIHPELCVKFSAYQRGRAATRP